MPGPQLRNNRLSRILDQLVFYGLESFGLYYGTYRGMVKDNVDANNRGRLKVYVPSVGDTEANTRVALPILPSAGPGFGFLATTPAVGDVVYIRFEMGRLDAPLWIGSWWINDAMPEDFRDPNIQGWITRGGHKIILDDRGDQQLIRVEHSPSGSFVLMDHDGNITVSNRDGFVVNLGNAAVEAAVLGDTLKALLGETMDAIQQITVPTSTGTSGPPINLAAFASIRSRLDMALSRVVKVT